MPITVGRNFEEGLQGGAEEMDMVAWGAFLSGLGTLLVALIGVAVLVYDLRLRGRQLSEALARANANITIDLHVSVQSRLRKPLTKLEWILETRVVVNNGSSQIWAIPALYIHARAAPLTSEEARARTFSEMDFGSLRSCGQLSQPVNIARFPKSIFWLGPGETDSVVRWDIVSDEFVREFPVIVVRAEVFSVPDELIGASYSPENDLSGRRVRWLDFMEGDGGARHGKVVVTTATEDIPGGPKKGGWAILKADADEIDREQSVAMKTVLANMSKTGRQALVVFGDDAAANPRHQADG